MVVVVTPFLLVVVVRTVDTPGPPPKLENITRVLDPPKGSSPKGKPESNPPKLPNPLKGKSAKGSLVLLAPKPPPPKNDPKGESSSNSMSRSEAERARNAPQREGKERGGGGKGAKF